MLDPVGILIVTVLASVFGMAILGSLRSAAIPGIGRWGVSNGVAIVALLLFATQGRAPALLSIVAANGLIAYAIVLAYQGCRQFFHLRPAAPLPHAAAAAMLAGIVYWYYVKPDFGARVAIASLFCAGMYAAFCRLAWRGRPPGRPLYSYGFMIVCTALYTVGHLVRAFVYGAGWVHQSTLLQAVPLNIVFLSIGALSLPTLSIGMVMLAHDRMAESLERRANVDELTGALTRSGFFAKADAALARASMSGERFAFVILDIDHFKSINDRYGHAAGDHVLHEFGRRVLASLRDADLFGRLGGEEFGILYARTGADEALARVDALRVGTATVGREGGDAHTLRYTFSAGLDECRRGEPLAAVMARADAVLYAAKTSGRDRVLAA